MGSSRDIPYNQIQYYLDHGMAVASLEYRMVPQWVCLRGMGGSLLISSAASYIPRSGKICSMRTSISSSN